jgi:hypothetical protein
MAVKHISMILNFKPLTVVLLEMLQDGLNSVNVLRDMLDNFVSHAHPDIVTAQPMEDLSCLAFHVTVTSMLKFVTLKLEDAFVNTIPQEIIAINALGKIFNFNLFNLF